MLGKERSGDFLSLGLKIWRRDECAIHQKQRWPITTLNFFALSASSDYVPVENFFSSVLKEVKILPYLKHIWGLNFRKKLK